MPSERKVRQLERLKQFLEESKGIIFTDHTGTSVNDLTRFRKELAKVNASFHIVKNNLLKLAWKEVKNEEIDETLLTGPTSVLLTGNDISAGARILKNYIKEMQKPVPKVIYFGRNSTQTISSISSPAYRPRANCVPNSLEDCKHLS